MPILYNNSYNPNDWNLKYVRYWLMVDFKKNRQTLIFKMDFATHDRLKCQSLMIFLKSTIKPITWDLSYLYYKNCHKIGITMGT